MASGLGDLDSQSLPFVETLYARYREDPESVAENWREVFRAMDAEMEGEVQLGPSFIPHSIFNPAGGSAAASIPARSHTVVARRPSGAPDSERIAFFRSLPLFRELADPELAAISELAHELTVQAGEVVVREGDPGQDLFVVTQGKVQVRREGRFFAELGAGEVFGEMAVFDAQPRSADIVAKERVELLRIRGADLLDLIDRQSGIARGIIRMLSRRLRESSSRQDRVDQLIRAYRVRGHLLADLDPLGLPKEVYPELNPAYYGFGPEDLDQAFSSATIPGRPTMTLRDILTHLRNTYCRSIGVQFMHIDDLRVKMWLQEKMESTQNTRELSPEEQVRILTKLTDGEIFEQFIHKKFIGAKRFSLEGAESLIPLLDLAIEDAGTRGIDEVVIGMAHRGRLNVLANILGKSPRQIFREFDDAEADRKQGRGDVKYHLGFSSDRITQVGHKVHLSLCFNPSHLEFVTPVVMGRVRAKQDRYADEERRRCLGVCIHGDASFAGQGVVQESLNMSELPGYHTGGTLHIIVNNQVGFTTDPRDGRSTPYATDVAKMLQIPIIHVNGEDPEAVAQAIHLAMEFRSEFHRDVVIDMYCYRRHGHNEGDEPAFTQPLLYKHIRKRKTVREAYLDNILALGAVFQAQAEDIAVQRRRVLEQELDEARAEDYDTRDLTHGQGIWKYYSGGEDTSVPETYAPVPEERAKRLLAKLHELPSHFTPHPKFKRLFSQREEMVAGTRPLDWAAGEALAFATLLTDGARVRISGQDSERGTFSHRHAVLHDYEAGEKYRPLGHLDEVQGQFEIYNSPLSETGVLAFDYGYSLDFPEALVAWEAQFGDFANGAQVIIDQFITSGEDKWNRLSGLVLLLPHGFEGQGPEHSSARLERFLTAAADDNIQVVNLTTPAQIFHCLRRQVARPYRKPLVVMSPKSLLRHPRAVSEWKEICEGRFQRIIPEGAEVDPAKVRRVLLVSGKFYYELLERRESESIDDVAIVRVEQLHPFDDGLLEQVLSPYPDGVEVVWVQEEPRNMGAWPFFWMRTGDSWFGKYPFRCVSRKASASPATGSAAAHKIEQEKLLQEAFSR